MRHLSSPSTTTSPASPAHRIERLFGPAVATPPRLDPPRRAGQEHSAPPIAASRLPVCPSARLKHPELAATATALPTHASGTHARHDTRPTPEHPALHPTCTPPHPSTARRLRPSLRNRDPAALDVASSLAAQSASQRAHRHRDARRLTCPTSPALPPTGMHIGRR
ncbi:hypothetical protein CC80DRAFT_556341 [Byssothecium circinans]|uniref:Uncharacterized protein n=1 Tax=Byssothecium circinans TaxID=147558 RepID=A0A6A5T853_9PLEO|nr:hypothetical protein CC80DRAFT_556341 [Byssothecium circinans]